MASNPNSEDTRGKSKAKIQRIAKPIKKRLILFICSITQNEIMHILWARHPTEPCSPRVPPTQACGTGAVLLTPRSHETLCRCFEISKSLLSFASFFFEHRPLTCENLKLRLQTQLPEPQLQLPVIVCVSNCKWLSQAAWILGVREIMHRSAINTNGGLHAQILHTPRKE